MTSRVKRARKEAPAKRVRASEGQNTPHDFFSTLTIEQLAAVQGVKPLKDPAVLAGAWPDDENLDQFLEETYRSRRA